MNFEEIKIELLPKHLFMLSQILDKTEFKAEKSESMQQLGVNMMLSLLKGLHKAENEINGFINDIYKIADSQNLSFKDYTKAIKGIFDSSDFQEAWSMLNV